MLLPGAFFYPFRGSGVIITIFASLLFAGLDFIIGHSWSLLLVLAAIGVVVFLAGIGLLLAGVATQIVPIGVLGFLLMLGGIWLAVASIRPGQAGDVPVSEGHHCPQVKSGQVRYVILGNGFGPGGQNSSSSAIMQWVQANGRPVSASELGDSSGSQQTQLYYLSALQQGANA